MNSMIIRQNKTADGLRSRLFDTLDALIDGKISSEKVSNVCFISEQILNSAKLELEIEMSKEKIIKDTREFERTDRIAKEEAVFALSEKINDIVEIEDE